MAEPEREPEQSEPEPEQASSGSSSDSSGASGAAAATATAAHAACSWWYPRVAGRGATLKSTVLPLPPGFAEFLLQDGVVLPPSFREAAQGTAADDSWSDQSEEDDSDSDSDSGSEEADTRPAVPADFPELARQLQAAIDTSGRAGVFPRLTWSAPTDAAWMAADSTLSCRTPAQVLLLLKSSDKVSNDLSKRQHAQHCIMLRKYRSINAGLEFRCFAAGGRLVAITQLRCDQRFSFLQDAQVQECITRAIVSTYEQRLRPQLTGLPQNAVLDMYVEQRGSEGAMDGGYRAWLTDVEAFHSDTDALLFTWDEVLKLASPSVASEPEEVHSPVAAEADADVTAGTSADVQADGDDGDAEAAKLPELRVIGMELPIVPSQKVAIAHLCNAHSFVLRVTAWALCEHIQHCSVHDSPRARVCVCACVCVRACLCSVVRRCMTGCPMIWWMCLRARR